MPTQIGNIITPVHSLWWVSLLTHPTELPQGVIEAQNPQEELKQSGMSECK